MKAKYNAIAKQLKTATSKITHEEWNYIINVLKEQSNLNASIIDQKINEVVFRAFEQIVNKHLNNKENPHDVTKEQVGLGNVENKSSATIRSEIEVSDLPDIPQNKIIELVNRLLLIESDIDDLEKDKVSTPIPGLENIDRLYGIDKNGNQVVFYGSVQSIDDAYVKRNVIGQIFEVEQHKNNNQAHKGLFDEKLDNFDLLTEQTISLLNDYMIINRDGVAYKTTIAKLMDNAGFGDIFIIVDKLPTEDIIPNKIYLLPKDDTEVGNLWNEYIYLNGQWELIGSVTVDLTNYYDKNEIDNLLLGKVDKSLNYGLIADDDYGKFINAEKVVNENEFEIELEAGSEVTLPFDLTIGKLMGLTLYVNSALMLDKGVPQLNYDWYDSEEGYFVLENVGHSFAWYFSYGDNLHADKNTVLDMGSMGGELKFLVNIRGYVDSQIGDLADILASI